MTADADAQDWEGREDEDLWYDLHGSPPSPRKSLPDPIYLQTPLDLQPNSAVTVTSSNSIFLRVNGGTPVEICAATPISIVAPVRIQLSPAYSLGPDFLRGWHKLPDELKMRVLSHNLVRPYLIGGPFKTYSNHLAMGPEIANLARVVFYGKNVFGMWTRRHLNGQAYFRHPNPAIGPHIRLLDLCIDIREQEWKFLQRVSAGQYNLTNLRWVDVKLSWTTSLPFDIDIEDWAPFIVTVAADGVVHFACKGSVEFCRRTDRRISGFKEGSSEMALLLRREKELRDRIHFERRPVVTNESWTEARD